MKAKEAKMRVIPIDEQRFAAKIVSLVEVVPENDFDSGIQKATPEGMPIWKIRLLTRDGEDDSRRPDLTEVKVPALSKPMVDPGVKPMFGGLVGLVWSSNGSGGVSLRADSMSTTDKPSTKREPAATSKAAA